MSETKKIKINKKGVGGVRKVNKKGGCAFKLMELPVFWWDGQKHHDNKTFAQKKQTC